MDITSFRLFTGQSGDRFSDASSWPPAGIPTDGTAILIPKDITAVMDLDVTYGDVVVATGGRIDVEGSRQMATGGALIGGVVTGTALDGPLFIAPGGTGRVGGQLPSTELAGNVSITHPTVVDGKLTIEGPFVFDDGSLVAQSLEVRGGGRIAQTGGRILVEGRAHIHGQPSAFSGGTLVARGDLDTQLPEQLPAIEGSGTHVLVLDAPVAQTVLSPAGNSEGWNDINALAPDIEIAARLEAGGLFFVGAGAVVAGGTIRTDDVFVAEGGTMAADFVAIGGTPTVNGVWDVPTLGVIVPAPIHDLPFTNLSVLTGDVGVTRLDRDLEVPGFFDFDPPNNFFDVNGHTLTVRGTFSARSNFIMTLPSSRVILDGPATIAPEVDDNLSAGEFVINGNSLAWLRETRNYGPAVTWRFTNAAVTADGPFSGTELGIIAVDPGAQLTLDGPDLQLQSIDLAGELVIPPGTFVSTNSVVFIPGGVLTCTGGQLVAFACNDVAAPGNCPLECP